MSARGMTLVEVLAALVILGIAASALTPWLREAIRTAARAEHAVTPSTTSDALVADLMAARDPWGLDALEVGRSLSVVVPGHEGVVVEVGRLTGRDPLGGAWFEASVHAGGLGRGRAFWMPIREGGP